MEIPSSVLIDSINYKIEIKDKPIIMDGKEHCGLIKFYEDVILLSGSIGESQRVTSLAHEIIHGILFSRGLPSDNEFLVEQFGRGFINLCRDNPGLNSIIKGVRISNSTIRIDSIIYSIILSEEEDMLKDNELVDGYTDCLECNIYLCKNLDSERMKNVFFECIIAAIIHERSIEIPDDEICFRRQLSNGVINLLQDNPQILQVFSKKYSS